MGYRRPVYKGEVLEMAEKIKEKCSYFYINTLYRRQNDAWWLENSKGYLHIFIPKKRKDLFNNVVYCLNRYRILIKGTLIFINSSDFKRFEEL